MCLCFIKLLIHVLCHHQPAHSYMFMFHLYPCIYTHATWCLPLLGWLWYHLMLCQYICEKVYHDDSLCARVIYFWDFVIVFLLQSRDAWHGSGDSFTLTDLYIVQLPSCFTWIYLVSFEWTVLSAHPWTCQFIKRGSTGKLLFKNFLHLPSFCSDMAFNDPTGKKR